jgi:hypothetical protein
LPTQKFTLTLALATMGFTSAFLLSLVLPNLIFGNAGTSSISRDLGVQTVRVILFFASCACIFGITPYIIFDFYKISRLEAAMSHHIRSSMQVVMLDIENASSATTNAEALKLLDHAFKTCENMVENLPERISKEAPRFEAAPATAESKPKL